MVGGGVSQLGRGHDFGAMDWMWEQGTTWKSWGNDKSMGIEKNKMRVVEKYPVVVR